MLEGIFTAIFTLAVIVAILFAAWWFTKKVASGSSFSSPQSRYMKIIDRIPLAQDRFIVLVQVEEKVYMAGVTASQITLLAELDKEPEMLQAQPLTTAPDVNFRELFQKVRGRRNNGK